MKYFIVNTHDPYMTSKTGGKHTHIRVLIDELKSRKVDYTLITPKVSTGQRLFYRALRRAKLISKDHYFLKRLNEQEVSMKRTLFNLLKNSKNDIMVHSHDVIATMAANSVKRKLKLDFKIITTVHGYFAYEAINNRSVSGNDNILNQLLNIEKDAYDSSDAIIAVDSRLKRHIDEIVNHDRIYVMHNFVDLRRFCFLDETQKRMLKKRLFPKYADRSIILCPRRLVPKNGIMILAKSGLRLKEKANLPFLIAYAGDGMLRKELLGFIKRNSLQDYICLLGIVPYDQIANYYGASNIVVIPSTHSDKVEEATSISMLESMSIGTLTVVSNIGGLAEVINHKKNGLIFQDGDIEELSDLLKEVIENIKSEEIVNLRKSASEYVYKNHNVKNYVDTLFSIFEKIWYS